MKTVLHYIRPRLSAICLGLCIKFGGTIVELLLPWMLSVILDECVPAHDGRGIWLWGLGMIGCAALAWAGNTIANRMSTRTSRDITGRLRGDLFDRVLHLTCAQEDAFTTPSLISRLTSDTYNVHQMIDRMQRLGVRAPILLIGGIAVSLRLEPVLTLVLIATLPLLALVIFLVTGRGIKMYKSAQTALDLLVRRAQESMGGIRVIQALSKTDYECARFDEANRAVANSECKADLLMNITNPMMNLLLNLGLTGVIVVGAWRVNAGLLQTGTIIAFLSYFTIILNALMMVSRLFMLYSKGAASAARIEEVFTAADTLPVQALSPAEAEDHLVFDHVRFSYDKVRNNLTDVSFSVKRGGTLGIIGPTGSGKTTILNLLLRFYDADSGAVRIGGQDVRSIPPDLLHQMFGAAFQNDFLYAGPLWETIDFGRGLPRTDIEAAARTAQMDFAPDGGFDRTIAPRGRDLSGGQKQRVLLARALAAQPPILILDDSSSALDYKTDAAFRQALARALPHTTKVIVAQRVSAIRNADCILVLEDGAAIGCGSHNTLMQCCPAYRATALAQMGEVE